ncbi:Dabb family protein [Vogesella sp. XCS3]|uniref:Dabb family protein n=1 Tax=Vogesella sp. XCS3 TaxID=2877939 RepID=UPI001D09EFED|nr:Dabb family protein [Vogesella sp. XCS3]UDM16356.1 Dabb family protein [Vogesella sp. XCS3]
MIEHIVLFRFAPHASRADTDAVLAAFAALPAAIAQVRDFRAGTDISPENLAQGYTHGWLLRFDDAAALRHYLAHPAHQAFVAQVQPLLAQALVFDFDSGHA